MAPALIALSTLCIFPLATFLPIKRVYSDIPSLAIVLWLLIANIIRTVNTVSWNGNVNVKYELWCDIATKLLLGTNVALPGAFLCIGRTLESISSGRKLLTDPRVKRNSKIFELLCCYMIPIIYMFLHIISQDRRFDLVQDFGCSASIHPSSPALVTIWTLPLVLCVIALILCGVSVHHSFKMNTLAFGDHLSTRCEMSSSLFFRRLAIAMVVTGVSAVTIIFSLFSIPALQDWSSWENVHAKLHEINIVSVPQEIDNIRLNWWTLFVVSAIFIVLTLGIGKEPRDSYQWFVRQFKRRDQILQRFKSVSFPVRRLQVQLPRPVIARSKSQTSQRGPHMVELKSGWDDMVDFKYPKSSSPTKGPKSLLSAPPSPVPSRSPSSASMRGDFVGTGNTSSMSAEDTTFANSTISYLGSPPAQTLGVSSPMAFVLPSPPPPFHLPRRPIPALSVSVVDPVLPHFDKPLVVSPSVRSPTPATKSQPRLASVFHAEWPVPPTTPSPTGSVSSRYEIQQIPRSVSPAHSTQSSIGNVSDVLSYYRQGRPFEGSIASVGSIGVPVMMTATPVVVQRAPSVKRSLQSLRASWERARAGSTSLVYPEGIHMTVVQETV